MTLAHDPRIEDLLGAYALDAVDDGERAEIESHLRDCPRCAIEVQEHREVAAILSSTSADAPEELWSSIEDSIAPPENVLPFRRPRAKRSPSNWILSIAAAAALVLVGAVFLQSARIDQLSQEVAAERAQLEMVSEALTDRPLSAAVEAALSDPGSRIVTIEATDVAGAGAVTVVLTQDGAGYVLDDSLPELPEGQTYQLWAVSGDQVVSAGLFGTDVADGAFRIDPGSVSALAITPEVAGGVVVSSNDAVALIALDA